MSNSITLHTSHTKQIVETVFPTTYTVTAKDYRCLDWSNNFGYDFGYDGYLVRIWDENLVGSLALLRKNEDTGEWHARMIDQ